MRAFMRRSVHLMEELSRSSAENEARIALSRSGYLYVHQDSLESSISSESVADHCLPLAARDVASMYPWLSSACTRAVLAENAGWLSAHGLGMSLLSSLQESRSGNAVSVMVGWDFAGAIGEEDKLQGVIVRNAATKEELRISCGAFVNATGPMLSATHQAALASLSSAAHAPLPVHNDLHAKVILHDVLGYTTHCTAHVPITRYTSHVTSHTSHVTRHTSHVTRHTSHVTRHTSHVTRHTSHVTRHTSHVTQNYSSHCAYDYP